MSGRPWNHNLHYHPAILDAVPPGATRALDVGCGPGVLARELAARVPEVVGLDLHRPSLDRARASTPAGSGVSYVEGDVLADDPAHGVVPGSFDLVASVATLHHLDARRGLARMAALLRPGGVLAVVGLARSVLPRDVPRELAATVWHRRYAWSRDVRRHGGVWKHGAPVVWPPPETYDGMRAIAAEVLPGSRFRRRLLWRYTLHWTRPTVRG